jgi:hypothetical protein
LPGIDTELVRKLKFIVWFSLIAVLFNLTFPNNISGKIYESGKINSHYAGFSPEPVVFGTLFHNRLKLFSRRSFCFAHERFRAARVFRAGALFYLIFN